MTISKNLYIIIIILFIRYTSLHQDKIFPFSGKADVKGDYHNILNIPLSSGTTWKEYKPLLINEAIPFLKDFNPDLIIICAGFDALGSDEMASVRIQWLIVHWSMII